MHNQDEIDIIPPHTRLVIFDVDGTLYNQSELRRFMLKDLLSYYIKNPFKIKDLYILFFFRKLREKNAGYCGADLNQEQYQWCADRTNSKIERVKQVVEKWIHSEPLKYLSRCLYPGMELLCRNLKYQGVSTAVYSDYPAAAKLQALNISVDLIVSSTDKQINCFKPSPAGINYICQAFSVPKESVVFIGDRYSRDGLCARNASVPFILIPKNKKKAAIKTNNLVKPVNNL